MGKYKIKERSIPMIQKLKKLIATSLVLAVMVLPVIAVVPAGAQSISNCTGDTGNISKCLDAGTCQTNLKADGTCPTATNAENRVGDIIRTVINIISLIVGVIAVIMIIIGGLKYITSAGDSGNVTSAKNTILYALVGLVIVALAQIIVRFVLGKVT